MQLHFGANPNTSLTQIPCSSNYKLNCHNFIITHLNSRKTHNFHTIWKVMIINDNKNNGSKCRAFGGIGVLAAAAVLSTPPPTEETLSNIPQTLSSKSCEFGSSSVECEDMKVKRIQKPKSRNAERCTSKCATTCARGGFGSPGEGPLNLRGPIVVFKEGFRSRQYCLVECSDICNLLDDADKGRK
ncbi:uncharacterized protein LOC141591762 [Silene latifolia]|uniref:uncharacterized protein LOC141591762 n=1 Tax=Silene latifolia TaxID=37657 RepID=UPI003D76BC5F